MKILARNRKIFFTTYELVYKDANEDRRYTFPCNEFGEVSLESLSPSEINLLERCISGEDLEVLDPSVQETYKSYVAAAIGLCDVCNEQIVIDSISNVSF